MGKGGENMVLFIRGEIYTLREIGRMRGGGWLVGHRQTTEKRRSNGR
jgi:hypothetical protein